MNTTTYPLGRDHWDRAAIDCLERRDRAGHYWMTRGPVPPGVRPPLDEDP